MEKEKFEKDFEMIQHRDGIVFIELDNDSIFYANYYSIFYKLKYVKLFQDDKEIGRSSLAHIKEVY